MINLLICDDHQLMIDGIKLMISDESDMQCIGEALNGQEAIEFIDENKVDLLIMDINMPVLNGLETCKILSKKHPNIKVIGLSMLKDIELVQNMIKYGAKGYLLKNSGQDEVLKTIREVYAGNTHFDTQLLNAILKINAKRKRKAQNNLFPNYPEEKKRFFLLLLKNTPPQKFQKSFSSVLER